MCFDDLGCFSILPSYDNAGDYLPNTPHETGAQFLLYTRKDMGLPEISDTQTIKSGFKADHMTYFIIHSYRDNGMGPEVQNMTSALLDAEDDNVFAVDWENGADSNYNQAASNIRVVGALVARLIKRLSEQTCANYGQFHLIGHSLGAYISSHAGKRIKGIGRITGLDPAGYLFKGEAPAVRLDKNDATFVDVIRTDGEPLI